MIHCSLILFNLNQLAGCHTVVNETHELSTSSQDSFESNHNMHQSNISQEYPHSIGEILHLLKMKLGIHLKL